jgi:cell division protein FtsW (lipid II flippase)
MSNLIIQVSKYLIIILMALYTLQCFTVFSRKDEDDRNFMFLRQNVLMFFMHFVAFMVLYLEIGDVTVLMFYGAQVAYFLATLILFRLFYPLASRLLINNMCMLICIGFIMITRISYDQSVKQFKIIAISTVVALIIPLLIRKLRFITKMYWFYALTGIGLLALVAIMAQSTYGAKLSFTVGGISIQPSEFVKIIFVFAIAGLLSNAREFKGIVMATVLAALHVLILVVSKDLGSALIFFVTYLVMLFVATRNPFYVLAGILAGSLAAVGAYFLFAHVRVRVQAWKDPFADYYSGGYQICQSLFSIAAGGWFGTGLYQGTPTAISFVEQDMMFSAVVEELGSIFGICLILVCMSCFIMFVNIAMQLANRFYRLVAVGLGATYAAQVFLTIGGGIKLIPLTGVTLPLVSYGGSSALSTLIMFAIVQGLYMLQRDEEHRLRQKEEENRDYDVRSGETYSRDYAGFSGRGYDDRGYRDGYHVPDDRDYVDGYGSQRDRDYEDGYGSQRDRGYEDGYGSQRDRGYEDGYRNQRNRSYEDGYGYEDPYGTQSGRGYREEYEVQKDRRYEDSYEGRFR